MGEGIIGILPAKQATLIFTSDRLIVQKRGILSRLSAGPFYYIRLDFSDSEAKDLRNAHKRAQEFSQMSVEDIMADKRSFALPYSDISSVEVSNTGVREQGLKFSVGTDKKEKKYKFNFMTDYLPLGWKLLSSTLQEKITFPQDYYKGIRLEEELKNSECYLLAEDYCILLQSLGIETDISFISPVNYLTALIKLSGQNIDYIHRYALFGRLQRTMYIVENVKGRLGKTKTKRKGKGEQLNFKWVGDDRLSNILNQDSILKNTILQLMLQNRIKDIYIDSFKDKEKEIHVEEQKESIYSGRFVSFHSKPGTEYPLLPSKEFLNSMDKIAHHVRGLLS